MRAPAYNFATGAIFIMKRHKFKIISLLAVFVLSVSLACVSTVFAAAETTYTPSNVFSTSNATTNTEQGYLAYDLYDGANVYYRKDLALKWYENADGAAYFSTVFSFGGSYNFDSFTMTFEAAPFTSNKEGKSSNTLVFTAGADNALSVSVNGAAAERAAASEDGSVTVSFTEDANGEFTVSVNNQPLAEKFKNIGMYYADYAASTADNPLTPLTFSVDLKEGAESQLFVVRSLNGQSFALNDSGSVTDTEAPVLVVNSEIRLFILGSELDFDYVAIDVLDSSVSTTRYYYAYDPENGRVGFDVEGQDTTYEQMNSDKRFYETDFANFAENETGYLSVAFRLSDGDNSEYYFIEWFADDSALAAQADGYSYISVVRPGRVTATPSYTFYDESGATGDIGLYQDAVRQASKNEDGSGIQVGTGAYFYIPSLKAYITDDTCGYTDMTFDLYWRTKSSDTQSSTDLSYDELRIELTAEGVYEFRVVPVNKLGNAIEVTDEKGNPVSVISSSNIWTVQGIPTFSFTVQYNGLSIEEPEAGEDGYIDVTYTFDSFEIISLSDAHTSPVTEYKLYYLIPNEQYEGQTIPADDLRASLLGLTEEANGVCAYGTWVEIGEDDEDNEYAESWNASSLSFVPKTSGYFGVTVRAYDSGLSIGAKTEAAVANISSRTDVLPGETYWLQNNILSVVFICIGGVCLIGIIVLLLIKPKDKRAAKAAPAEGDPAKAAEKDDLKTKRKNRK